jgi:hypothetical protein
MTIMECVQKDEEEAKVERRVGINKVIAVVMSKDSRRGVYSGEADAPCKQVS